ncbi:hypothetical protein CPT_Slocum_074 [Serratia phage Slocum]|nr:hypothetical protein CPT_Slocum_074 [Serratia phage Slocum]URC22460.1 hypothetical protein KAMAJI_00320 [Serratia phage vB_SmaM-Kamaji]
MIKCLKVLALPIGALAAMAAGPVAGIGALIIVYFAFDILA